MTILRIIWLSLFILVTMTLSGWAQSPEPETPPAPNETVVAVDPNAAPENIALEDRPATAAIDFDDPAIRAAIEARDEAEKAFTEAVREQMEAAAALAAKEQSEGPAKPSIIPANAEEAKALLSRIWNKLLEWLTSIKFLAQLGAIVLAIILSPLIARIVRKRLFFFRDKPAEGVKFRVFRDYMFQTGSLLRPIVLVGLLILFGAIVKAVPIAGDTWLIKIAQSLALVFLLYKAIKQFIKNSLFQKIAVWTVIPLALIMLFGYYDDLVENLNGITLMKMGDTPISMMTVILLLVFGALFFKLGNIANSKGQTAIRSQDGLDVATQEVVGKIFQIVLFTIVFILVMSAAKVPLSGLVVIFSALSLGIGLGLQPVAANFASGMIILFDRSVQSGDYVVLPDGQEGFVEAINMRQTVVETTDGKDIMVPNTKFIEEAYENWTHKDPRQRYEVHFTVGFDTDLDVLEDLIIPAFLEHKSVLTEPEMPDLEFREFGEYGAKMAVEFWCSGIDDGPNKFTSDLNFIVWRLLRDNNIKIPFPQMVVHKK